MFKNNRYKFFLDVPVLDLYILMFSPCPFLCISAERKWPFITFGSCMGSCFQIYLPSALPLNVHQEQGSQFLSWSIHIRLQSEVLWWSQTNSASVSLNINFPTELLPTGSKFCLLSTTYFTQYYLQKHFEAYAGSMLISEIIESYNTAPSNFLPYSTRRFRTCVSESAL